MTSQPDANQRQTFFLSSNCINSLICDCAYWLDFVFKLCTRTLFHGCNPLHCSSSLHQWTASFDQMIKVHCCICTTYVYWFWFIATLWLPHSAEPASRTLGYSSVCFDRFVGVGTANALRSLLGSLMWPSCSSADCYLVSSTVSEVKHSTLEPRPPCTYLQFFVPWGF